MSDIFTSAKLEIRKNLRDLGNTRQSLIIGDQQVQNLKVNIYSPSIIIK